MTTRWCLLAFFGIAVVLRGCSLLISMRNENRLRAEGATEHGIGNSRALAGLHVAFYVAAVAEGLWRNCPIGAINLLGVGLYAFSMFVLFYVIRELDGIWTVKILIATEHELIQSWLFRKVRHPNYFLNILPELVAMAMVMKAWLVPTPLFICYLVALFKRIKLEEEAMRERFPQYAPDP